MGAEGSWFCVLEGGTQPLPHLPLPTPCFKPHQKEDPRAFYMRPGQTLGLQSCSAFAKEMPKRTGGGGWGDGVEGVEGGNDRVQQI